MRIKFTILEVIFFIMAISLRGVLCWLNPPINAFDNHFEPISLIMQHGIIPAKDACWECFQPPIFYVVSAKIGNLAIDMGARRTQITKIIQFTSFFYGILTLGIIYLILNRLNLSDFSKIIAFGVICFLPRHIYMSAMLSNDTISYLFVAICIYILLIAIERNFSFGSLMILSLVMTITIFTKYNSLVVIPMVLVVFILAFLNLSAADKKKKTVLFCLTLFVPLSILSAHMVSNIKNYGRALPGNYEIFRNLSVHQPRDAGGINFLNFKPRESIETPILAPGKLNSFWTLIYSSMWFDTEPKFLYFMDANQAWWGHYYCWLRGEKNFPGDNYAISKITLLEGSALITLGLVPLMLAILGIYPYCITGLKAYKKSNWLEVAKMSIFPVLFISNAAGIIAITLKLPVFSTMKASYFLGSMPAFAVFLGNGVMTCEKRRILKWAMIIIFGTLFILVSGHILHICLYLHQCCPVN